MGLKASSVVEGGNPIMLEELAGPCMLTLLHISFEVPFAREEICSPTLPRPQSEIVGGGVYLL